MILYDFILFYFIALGDLQTQIEAELPRGQQPRMAATWRPYGYPCEWHMASRMS
jgi:hypothetical protein